MSLSIESALTVNIRTQADITSSTATSFTDGRSIVHRIWPPLVIAFGLVLNAAWVAVLGYGIVSLIKVF